MTEREVKFEVTYPMSFIQDLLAEALTTSRDDAMFTMLGYYPDIVDWGVEFSTFGSSPEGRTLTFKGRVTIEDEFGHE